MVTAQRLKANANVLASMILIFRDGLDEAQARMGIQAIETFLKFVDKTEDASELEKAFQTMTKVINLIVDERGHLFHYLGPQPTLSEREKLEQETD